MTSLRGPALSAWLLAVALVLAMSAPAAGQTATGADVKAAFLFNFAKFVEWPAAAAGAEPGTFVIGVLGNDAIADSLTEFVKGKSHQGRPLSVRRLVPKDDLATVQVLFIGESASASLPELLKRLGRTSVLTVSDADRFCVSGGAIQFRTEADRVRFDVNLKAAEAAGLTVNSKLLKLAGTINPARN
jgi:hypothetical protein